VFRIFSFFMLATWRRGVEYDNISDRTPSLKLFKGRSDWCWNGWVPTYQQWPLLICSHLTVANKFTHSRSRKFVSINLDDAGFVRLSKTKLTFVFFTFSCTVAHCSPNPSATDVLSCFMKLMTCHVTCLLWARWDS